MVYHLLFGDEEGAPGSALTFFEDPRIRRGRPGPGMVHRLVWRVASPAALDFWADPLRPELRLVDPRTRPPGLLRP
jgi:glyoxalase family protein